MFRSLKDRLIQNINHKTAFIKVQNWQNLHFPIYHTSISDYTIKVPSLKETHHNLNTKYVQLWHWNEMKATFKRATLR